MSVPTYDAFVLEVRLLGELEAEASGRRLPLPAHPRGPALLAWLALHPGEHPRGPLAELLWPGLAPSNARASLRSAVWSMRRALAPHDRAVLDERTTIGLRCTTDLEAFERCIADGELAAALALCRGELLEGFDGHPWALAARAAHTRRVAELRAELAAR